MTRDMAIAKIKRIKHEMHTIDMDSDFMSRDDRKRYDELLRELKPLMGLVCATPLEVRNSLYERIRNLYDELRYAETFGKAELAKDIRAEIAITQSAMKEISTWIHSLGI